MNSRKNIFFLIRVSVSICIIYYLLSILDIDRLRVIVTEINIKFLFVPPVLMLVAYIFAALRWKLILREFNIDRQFGNLYFFYLSGAFYGMILPGVVSGDFVRIALCRQAGKEPVAFIATSVLVERLFGVFMLFVMTFLVVMTLSSLIPNAFRFPFIQELPYALLFFISAMALACFLSRWYLKEKDLSFVNTSWLKKPMEIFSALVQMRGRTFMFLSLLSGAFQALSIIGDFSIAVAMNISLSLPFFFLAAAVVFLATILPVSIGGLGLREGVFVFLLTKSGIQSSDAITLSFLIYFNRILSASFGAIAQPLVVKEQLRRDTNL